MQKRSRRALALFSLLSLCAAGATLALLRDPVPRMRARHSSLASVMEGPRSVENGYALTQVRLTATSGLAVDLLVRRTVHDSGRRLPLAVILGGHRTGQRSAQIVGHTQGVVVAALSYPFAGNSRPGALTFLNEIPLIRAAFLDTPPAIMLALDYLLSRPDVDTSRVEGIGVSLGAPFVCIAGALDPRLTRVWALHGSAGSYRPLEANFRRAIAFAPLRIAAAAVASVIIAGPRLDPVRWVADIAPRPFIMISAEDDERMPRASVDALYQSARQPKEQIWMAGGHVRADSTTVHALVQIVMGRITRDTRRDTRRSRGLAD